MAFLGHHLRVRQHPTHGHPVPLAVIPKDRSQHLRRVIKGIFRSNTSSMTLENRLRVLNPVLRGWGHFPVVALKVEPYRLTWQKTPLFASTSMESPVRNERRTPGSVRGRQNPPGQTQEGR